MLDHDPAQSAVWQPDSYVRTACFSFAALLSYAWHQLDNAHFQPLPADPADDPETPWLRWEVRPARTTASPLAVKQMVVPGESASSWWTLYGQRILSVLCGQEHAHCDWVTASGGNYLWAWRAAMDLSREYNYRFGTLPRISSVIWTLEAVPYSLRDTVADWSEPPPVMAEHLKVVVDGYYDTVQSCRKAIALTRHTHSWALRDVPPWINDYKGDTHQ